MPCKIFFFGFYISRIYINAEILFLVEENTKNVDEAADKERTKQINGDIGE